MKDWWCRAITILHLLPMEDQPASRQPARPLAASRPT
jgi:hypothetical protein